MKGPTGLKRKANPLDELITGADADAPPSVLLPYQQDWVADDSPLKIASKGRRVGLTWAEAADDVLIASAEDGSNVFYISATQDMALEYIEACAMWARHFNVAATEVEEGIFEDEGDKEIKMYRIDFPGSGKRIVALSSRPANLRGKQGVIVIDEAAFAPDLAGLLKAAMAMLLWGDKVRIISTHNGDDNPFNELIEEIRAGKRKGSVHTFRFREAVAQGLYRRVCMRKGITWTQEGEDAWVKDAYAFYGADAAEELDVIPSKSGGAYLTMAMIEARMSPFSPVIRHRWEPEFGHAPKHVRELEVDQWCKEELLPILERLDKHRQHVLGEDFGRVSDLSVLVIAEEGKDLTNRVRFQVELSNCPFEQQKQIASYIIRRLPNFRRGAFDGNGNGAYLAEVMIQEFGASAIEAVHLSETFYETNMPRFKAALQDGTYTDLPRDDEVRDDLRAIQVINGVPKIPKAKTQKADEKKLGRHGDSAVAHFLCHYAAKTDVPPIEFTPLPNNQGRWDGDGRDSDYSSNISGGW